MVWLSTPAGIVGAGPVDEQIKVVRPRYPKTPYAFPDLPPFQGHQFPPIEPGPDGQLDGFLPDHEDFLAVHAYAAVRHVLDVWQNYHRDVIPWHFANHQPQLEVIPELDWDNAQSGFGYLELGYNGNQPGPGSAYALNYDVVAHELGHQVLLSLMGTPENWQMLPVFGAFHESFADLTALLGLLHFETAIDRLLRRTRGELWLRNELNRIAELVDERQIRMASNPYRVSTAGATVHEQSRPITGALFDWLIDLYLDHLADDDLIDPSLVAFLRRHSRLDDRDADNVRRQVSESYRKTPYAFRVALQRSRDVLGETLADAVTQMHPDYLDRYGYLADSLLAAADRAVQPAAVSHLEHQLVRRELLPMANAVGGFDSLLPNTVSIGGEF